MKRSEFRFSCAASEDKVSFSFAAGNCSAGGSYENKSGREEAFVVNESAGTWERAEEAPGSGNLNAGGSAAVNSISCASTDGCAAGGYYTMSSGDAGAFVVDSF